jgi:hypothetical protein
VDLKASLDMMVKKESLPLSGIELFIFQTAYFSKTLHNEGVHGNAISLLEIL